MPDSRDARIKELEAQLAAHRTQSEAAIAELKAQLARATAPRSAVAITSITTSFGNLLEQSQLQASERAKQGVAATLQSLDIELRGFVELQGNAAHIVLPRPEEKVAPESLSVVKMTFTTIPPTGTAPHQDTQPHSSNPR
jgi:hypothetical protein